MDKDIKCHSYKYRYTYRKQVLYLCKYHSQLFNTRSKIKSMYDETNVVVLVYDIKLDTTYLFRNYSNMKLPHYPLYIYEK